MAREHHFQVSVQWQGNKGTGTSGYRAYGRDHLIHAPTKQPIDGSADQAFLGNNARWNPEDLMIASLAACHQLWYLHLCADAGIIVTHYEDHATGTMVSSDKGHFTQVTLHPRVTIRDGDDAALAAELHKQTHEKCFIANSVNFPVYCEPVIIHESEVVTE